MSPEQVRHRLLERRNIEFSRRLETTDFWAGLEFSRATILRSLLHNAAPRLREAVLEAHLHCLQVNGLSSDRPDSPACQLVAVTRRLTEKLSATWRHMTVGKRQGLARMAIRNKWSLEAGLQFAGYHGTEFYSRERLHTVTVDLNDEIRAGWATLSDAANAFRSGEPFSSDCQPPILTVEEVWGTPEEWIRFSEMANPPWTLLKKELKGLIGPHYQGAKAPFKLLTQSGQVLLQLEIVTGSSAGHFRYSYVMHDSLGEIVLVTSYETLLGLGLGIWDGLSTENVRAFCEQFAKIDDFIRRSLE